MTIPRDRYLERLIRKKGNGSVKIITGIRRCGKTTLLFDIFRNHLADSGVDDRHIIAIRLDERRNRRLHDADALCEEVEGRITDSATHYVLIDEIQLVDGFESAVSEINNLENTDVYVTGSNSKFLSTDIITEFRGRGDELRVFPLSFSEFASAFEGTAAEAWRQYMLYGGMPELLQRPEPEDKASYLRNLVRNVYLKDIRSRYLIDRKDDMEDIMGLLFSSIGCLSNPKRIADTLKTVKGSDISYETVSRYIDMLEDCFLFERASRYDVKGNQYIGSPFKYYAADVGLRNSFLNFRQTEPSHIMENVVYNELRSRGLSVDVGVVKARKSEEGRLVQYNAEIDFVVDRGDRRYYIQSAYTAEGREKKEQETRPFRELRDGFKRILIRGDEVPRHYDDNGVLNIWVIEFLTNPGSLDARRTRLGHGTDSLENSETTLWKSPAPSEWRTAQRTATTVGRGTFPGTRQEPDASRWMHMPVPGLYIVRRIPF